MKYILAMAAIPVVVWSVDGVARRSPPIAAKVVEVENVTERRSDVGTFRLRWSVVSDLPPMKEIVQEPLLLLHHEAAPVMAVAAASVRPPLSRRVSLDLCARHGMRTVHYGKRWRCRRG